MGSIASIRPPGFFSAYASSKGAVAAFTKDSARELGPSNIRVNCINPTFTNTAMIDSISKRRIQASIKSTPLGRIAGPEDIASTALFLSSDDSKMITGSEIIVDGGVTI